MDIEDRFSFMSFIEAEDPNALAEELTERLTTLLRESTDFDAGVERCVEALRALGHELFYLDENGADWVLYGGRYDRVPRGNFWFQAGTEEEAPSASVEWIP